MVFGRKKKEEQEVVETDEKASNMDQNQDLALAYGNEDEVNDDLSTADSIPPPPPTGDDTETKKEDLSQDDSRTLEESPSFGANENSEDSIDEKKEAESIKRKKLLLIAGCIISFFILLGLSIKYGKSRNRAGVNASLANGVEDSSLSSPIPDIEPEPVVDENDAAQDVASTTDTTSITGTDFLDPETSAPSIDFSTDGSSTSSSENLFADCVANEISVLTTCNGNGFASANMTFCLVDDVSDQFWQWVNTPPRTAQGLRNRWGYLRDDAGAEIAFLPEGTYEVGIYSDGDLMLNPNQYPLITSFEFVVNCRQ